MTQAAIRKKEMQQATKDKLANVKEELKMAKQQIQADKKKLVLGATSIVTMR